MPGVEPKESTFWLFSDQGIGANLAFGGDDEEKSVFFFEGEYLFGILIVGSDHVWMHSKVQP